MTKWSTIRAKFSVIKARQERSGEGNDKPFSAYVKAKDWHPKVMLFLNKICLHDKKFLDFAYRRADAALTGANSTKKKTSTNQVAELAAAIRSSSAASSAATRRSRPSRSV